MFKYAHIYECHIYITIIMQYDYYGRTSGKFTHVSNAHGTTSWLDHVICSHDMQARLHSVDILDMLPSSDHVPLSVVFNFSSTLAFIDSSTCPSNKVILIGQKLQTKTY